MLLGTDIDAVLTTLEALKVDVIGLNCSTGPGDMRDAIRFLGENAPMPIHCIPNAGLPIQGDDGETIFPETPRSWPRRCASSCRTSASASSAAAAAPRPPTSRRSARPSPISSRVPAPPAPAARELDDRGHRSRAVAGADDGRRARELAGVAGREGALLAEDYDGILQVAADQVEGGAHVLDLCVALTERTDEDEQMRLVAKSVSLTQPAPIQIDSTEPEVIATALDQIPGRAIVNSVNLEAGRAKMDQVMPMVIDHGAALIALTIDEVAWRRPPSARSRSPR